MKAPQTVISRPPLWLLPGALVFLYLHLFIPPNAPLWIGGDQTVYLVNASRMLHGEAIYRDFFQFTTPGTELFYLALFKVFGAREWIPNVALIALGLILMALVVALSKKVLSGWTEYLPALPVADHSVSCHLEYGAPISPGDAGLLVDFRAVSGLHRAVVESSELACVPGLSGRQDGVPIARSRPSPTATRCGSAIRICSVDSRLRVNDCA